MLKSVVVIVTLTTAVQATSPIFPGCPVKDMYLPCICHVLWRGQSMELTCRNVTMDVVRAVVDVAINNNHSFNQLTIENEDAMKLPDDLLNGVYVRNLQLKLPNLISLTAQVQLT